jgi:hypothetical protein
MREETSDIKNIDLILGLSPKNASKLEMPNKVVAVFGNMVETIFFKI